MNNLIHNLAEHKILYLIAVVMMVASGLYYFFSDKNKDLNRSKQSNLVYLAQDVRINKSDEQGKLEFFATIDELQQDLKTEQSAMKNVAATMFKNNVADVQIFAKTMHGYNDNQKVILSNGVIVTKITPTDEIQLTTDELTAYPKQKRIETNQQVFVQSKQASFISQGLSADFNTGLYEFSTVRGQYESE